MRISALVEVAGLLNEIESSTSRISDLVKAIKEYTFMDQAPVQNVDLINTLETTLTILNHKLKRGVTVHRDYQPLPMLVNSFGSEINQVWTNLIDNAIDAMGGKGDLTVRTYREDNCVVVEIGDNGPGISPEVLPRISSHSSPPKVWERAPASVSTRSKELSRNIEGTFRCARSPETRVFGYRCLWRKPLVNSPRPSFNCLVSRLAPRNSAPDALSWAGRTVRNEPLA